jgi:hypothetical protein
MARFLHSAQRVLPSYIMILKLGEHTRTGEEARYIGRTMSMGVECGERTASRERGVRVIGASVGGAGERKSECSGYCLQ